jgi:hypothetical protein
MVIFLREAFEAGKTTTVLVLFLYQLLAGLAHETILRLPSSTRLSAESSLVSGRSNSRRKTCALATLTVFHEGSVGIWVASNGRKWGSSRRRPA